MTAFQQQLAKVYETLKQANWINLSHQIDAESPHFPALPALEQKDLFTLKDGFHVQQLSVVTQYGYTYRPTLPLLYSRVTCSCHCLFTRS